MEVASKKLLKKQNMNGKLPAENGNKISGKETLKQLRDDKKEPTETKSKEQRVIFSLTCNLCSCYLSVVIGHSLINIFSFFKPQKEYFEREMEKRVISTNPLGKDRYYNRYWWFRRDGRIFVESSDSKQWGYYSSKEEV